MTQTKTHTTSVRNMEETHMKAIVYHTYGSPDVLKLEEVQKPVPQDDEVLVQVHATSVNAGDWHLLRAKPFLMRFMGFGLIKPKHTILGSDIAGRVEVVGRNVKQFQSGDEVFGNTAKYGFGGFAEYVSVPEEALVLKPTTLSFEEAAAVPQAALTALQGLRDKGHIQPGQKVLINGASGGLGTFAVQIAKAFGAEVTGVCSSKNVDMVRSIGADPVIDYTREDFTRSGQRYDFILDNVANHSLPETRRSLTPTGMLQSNNGTSGGRWFGTLGTVIKSAAASRFARQQLGPSIKFQNRADLHVLTGLIEAGKITPVIDGTYPLSGTPQAIGHVGK